MVSTSAEEADNFEVAVENASPDLMSSLEKALGESDQPKDDSEDMSKQDLLLVEPEHAQANAKPMLDEEQHSSNNELLVSPNRAGDDIVERPEYGSAVSRRHSVFDPVSFGKAVTDVDAKYADRGIFGFDPFRATRPRRPSRPAHNQAGSPLIPQVPILRSAHSLTDPGTWSGTPRTSHPNENPTSTSYDATTPAAQSYLLPATPPASGKRKWDAFAEDKHDQAETAVTSTGPLPHNLVQLLSLLEPDTADWTLAGMPPPIDGVGPDNVDNPPPSLNADSEKDFMEIAQMVVDQISSSTLDVLGEASISDELSLPRIQDTDQQHDLTRPWEQTIKGIFSSATSCNLIRYALVQDLPPDKDQSGKVQPRPVVRKGMDSVSVPANLVFPIQPPHVRVRRFEALWDVLPPALSFWEPLGLGPASGVKNVMAYCIYPNNAELTFAVRSFMDSVAAAYEGSRLGIHEKGEDVDDIEDGLVPVDLLNFETAEGVLQVFRQACIRLGTLLARVAAAIDFDNDESKPDEASNIGSFVVYIVDFFNHRNALEDICASFWALFQAYQHASRTSASTLRPDLVLQVIPISCVASSLAPVISTPSSMMAVAREVYDRCPPSLPTDDHSALHIPSASAIQLEENLPRQIQFKLTAEPPSDLMHENSHLHLAYALSLDGMWITAAWTDNAGKYQATVPYCLRGGRNFSEIAHEIWQATLGIMQARKVTWRLCIARAGVMERREADAWISLATAPSPIPIGTSLIAVDTDPLLGLHYAATILPAQPAAAALAAAALTPANTPGAQPGVSPDATAAAAGAPTPAATPSDPPAVPDLTNDPDAHLVDITDETCGIILSHRRNNSNNLTTYNPTLASGLLVKRGREHGGSVSPLPNFALAQHADEAPVGPLAAGFNLLWVGNTGKAASGEASTAVPPGRGTCESILREYLVMFRGLGLLARVRGVRGCRGGVVPWHVGVVVRGVGGLEGVM